VLGNDVTSLKDTLPPHLDSDNPDVKLPWNTLDSSKSKSIPLVSANAYLGARAIVQGLRLGADIIICGRVSDASPVIGAAWYWHSWNDTDYNRLAGALISGHLIECSAYVTGGNFSGFTEYDLEAFVEPGFPIAEIEADGSCVIAKHQNTGGIINEDTVRCQFLYELQGIIYLNSDVKAYLNDVTIKSVGKDRFVSHHLGGDKIADS
jgi:Acyclic terpene utilisation family protein AtuA